jgi:mutator protein MutT
VPVIFRGGRVLIARRQSNGLLGGLWEFTGGAMTKGESPRVGARRAAASEFGVRVRVGEPLGTVKHTFSHFRLTLHVVRCEYQSGEPRPTSAARVRWAYPRELDRFAWSSAHRRIVAMVQQSA